MNNMNIPKKDFFISYNKADLSWAEWIAWQLEEENYTTVLQAWDFRPGDNFVLNMQHAAGICERTILVLSQNYLMSLYTQPEWAVAFNRDPIGTYKSVLPIRVQMCEPEGLLKSITYIDLVNVLDKSVARQKLLTGVVRGRAKPKSPPVFPADLLMNAGNQSPSVKADIINAYNEVQIGGITEIDKINELANKLESMIEAHTSVIPSNAPQNLRDKAEKYEELQGKQLRLITSYEKVRNGQITDPKAIRELADEFMVIDNDPTTSKIVLFDALRAARSLQNRANAIEEEIRLWMIELINAYQSVKNGQVIDPETIRSLADEFESISNDPISRRYIDFDGFGAASNLRNRANAIENEGS